MLLNGDVLKDVRYHEDTNESKKILRLEKRLVIDFNTILLFIKKNFDFTLTNYNQQLYDIQNLVFNPVSELIRSYYQESYLVGTNYVNDVFSTASFLTNEDIEFIKTKSEEYTKRFFGRIDNLMNTSLDKFFKSMYDIPVGNSATFTTDDQIQFFTDRIEKTESYLFSSLAVAIVNEGLNEATIRKTRAILKLRQQSNLFSAAATNPELLDTLENIVPEPSNVGFQRTILSTEANRILESLRILFVTSKDERVCPICKPLERKTYLIEDPSIPIIPGATHLNCRCRLLLILL